MMLYDLRKPRRFDPREVKPLIIDTNRFNRNLMGEIMRTIAVVNVQAARSPKDAIRMLDEERCTVVFVEFSELNEMDPVKVTKAIRRMSEDFARRVPIIATSSQITKEQIIQGRNCGMDEFLKKPCSPNDVTQRLKMVIETPRPFVDSKTYIGPCRRRKNPADYHGARRRADDDVNAVKSISDEERAMIDKDSPLGASLVRLKMCCSLLLSDMNSGRSRVAQALSRCRQAGIGEQDKPFIQALTAFESYIARAILAKRIDRQVLQTGISTLEQLVALPREFESARQTIANALHEAIERKMAA